MKTFSLLYKSKNKIKNNNHATCCLSIQRKILVKKIKMVAQSTLLILNKHALCSQTLPSIFEEDSGTSRSRRHLLSFSLGFGFHEK